MVTVFLASKRRVYNHLSAGFDVPNRVTTASRYGLMRDLDLTACQRASTLRDVSQPVDALVFHQPPGPQLRLSSAEVCQKCERDHHQVALRRCELRDVVHPSRPDLPPVISAALHEPLECALTNILVVQLQALGSGLEGIKASVTALGRHSTRVAARRCDVENGMVHGVQTHQPTPIASAPQSTRQQPRPADGECQVFNDYPPHGVTCGGGTAGRSTRRTVIDWTIERTPRPRCLVGT
jgi:hypothetical protein